MIRHAAALSGRAAEVRTRAILGEAILPKMRRIDYGTGSLLAIWRTVGFVTRGRVTNACTSLRR